MPAGLTLDPVTGVISGIPTVVQNSMTCTITASNSTSSSSATVSITTLIGGVPIISYANPLSYTVGTAISPVTTPINSGGTILQRPYGQTTTFAGTGISGFNNGPSGVASFNGMNSITMDKFQNIYIADFFNSAIRKITPDGTVSTLANVSYPLSVATDNLGNVYAIKQYPSDIVKITPTGTVSVFSDHSNFSNPMDLAVDANGNVYVADRDYGIFRINALDNSITRLVNSIGYPGGMVVDNNNDIYYSCLLTHLIMKVSSGTIPGTTAGTVSVFAGSGTAGFTNGNGAAASFNNPYGLSIDNNGNIYVADQGNFAIRIIKPNGMVSTVSGSGVAGSADGSGAMATFNGPGGVAYDGAGNIYVIDGKIRKVVVTGYTISPALPGGLSMDPATGIISGTPNVLLPAKSYTITAFNASGSATATTTLEVNLPVINPPIITALSSTSAPASTPLTITGANFNSIAGNNIVFFGAVKANVSSSSSSTQLVVNVPLGATYQPISVLNTLTGLTGYSKMSFLPTYAPISQSPVINFDPANSTNTFTIGSRPDFLKVIDLDGDGLSDMVIANPSDNTISIFRNISANNALGFSSKINFPLGGAPVAINAGDLDGDGKPDLVVVDKSRNVVSVFQNTTTTGGVITFSTGMNFNIENSPSSVNLPISVNIADIDGYGRPDIIIVNLNSNTISILQNTTQGNNISFKSSAQHFATGTAPSSINIVDIDGDGLVDLVVTNFAQKTVSVILNTSTINKTNPTGITTAAIGIISFANKVDVVTGNQPSSVSVGDLDGDGKPDIIITNYGVGDNSVSVLHNSSVKGSTVFSAKVDFSTGNQPTSVQISDIDGDGKPDLVINNFNSKTISVLKNNYTSIGNISFTTKMDWATGNAPYSLSLGDMDGDGRPDVIVTNLLDNNILVLHNSTQ